MGQVPSSQNVTPLTAKEVNALIKKYPDLSGSGIQYYYIHFKSLLEGLKNVEEYNDVQKFQIWFIDIAFAELFQENGRRVMPTFDDYLQRLFEWRKASATTRLDYINKNGMVTAADLSLFIQQIEYYQCKVGDLVRTRDENPREGILAFIGRTHFAEGKWAGIQLSGPTGKNNGSIDSKKYFEAKERHGVFVEYKDAHWRHAKSIVESFGCKEKDGGMTREAFISKCESDLWLQSRLMVDPVIPDTLVRKSNEYS